MQGKAIKFLAGLLLLTAIIGFCAYLLFHGILRNYYTMLFPYMLGFFLIFNATLFFIFARISKSANKYFIRQFMLLIGVKIFIYLISAIIILVLFRREAVSIAVSAVVLYILYTGYEIAWFLSIAKRKEQVG
jgi:hypothetical protein